MAELRSINGANAIIQIKDSTGATRTIGYASDVTCVENFAIQRIDCLGEIESRDIEPIARAVSGSIGFMRMTVGEKDEELVEGGGAQNIGLIPPNTQSDDNTQSTRRVMDFFNNPFDLIIKDSDTFFNSDNSTAQKNRYRIIGCRPSSQSLTLNRGMIMGVNVTFEAIRLLEEDYAPDPDTEEE